LKDLLRNGRELKKRRDRIFEVIEDRRSKIEDRRNELIENDVSEESKSTKFGEVKLDLDGKLCEDSHDRFHHQIVFVD
jgi:hypothetical protein